MRKLHALLVCVVAVVVLVFVGFVVAADQSPWTTSTNPTFLKLAQLKDSAAPPESNIDCDKITVRLAGSSTMQEDCVVLTAMGLGGSQGIVFNGTSEAIQIIPPSPIFIGLNPIPNQELAFTYTSSSTIGMYMHFYRSVRSSLKPSPELFNGHLVYKLAKNPDFTLSNLAGKSQPMNPGTLAFSENGEWMIVDFPFQGFVRVNLATFEMIPFAPSLNQGNDFSNPSAQLTISNDGRYAAIKPGNYNEFRVYDIASCTGAVLPVSASSPKCQSRDYWPYINGQLAGLKALYQPRFTSHMQLYVTAQYEYAPSSYKVAQYSLTAPGENPAGIEYLGMGDSFASGQGAFNYISGTDIEGRKCHLSSVSYPFLLSAALYDSGHSVACSGGRMKDVVGQPQSYRGQNTPNQTKAELQNLGLLPSIFTDFSPGFLLQKDFVERYNPQNVTISIGGNDIGFANIIKSCVMPKLTSTTCYPTTEDQVELAESIRSKEKDLKNTYRQLSKPGRKLFVIGYPHIVVAGGNCADNVHLDEREVQMFTSLTDTLNQTIKRAADSVGALYVDVGNAFEGHRMCEVDSKDVAINGFTAGNDDGLKLFKFIGGESYHPNALGHELLKRAILGQTNNLQGIRQTNPPGTTSLPLSDAPKSGRATNLSISEDSLVPDIVAPLASIPATISGKTVQLKSSSSYSVRLDTSMTSISTLTTDATGVVSGSITIPESTSCGLHTLHVYGENIIKQPIDISKEVYVAPDFGCPDDQDACGPMQPGGTDADRDGIDDVCDPLITDPPQAAQYQAHLTGSSIRVVSGIGTATQQAASDGTAPPAIDDESLVAARERQSRLHLALLIMLLAIFGVSLKFQFAKATKA